MACAPCARKAAARKAALLANQNAIQPLADGYVRKKYIGPPEKLLSVRKEGGYGFRNTGEILIILEEDYKNKPEIWADV